MIAMLNSCLRFQLTPQVCNADNYVVVHCNDMSMESSPFYTWSDPWSGGHNNLGYHAPI